MKRTNTYKNVKKSRILSSTPNKSKYHEFSLLMSDITSESSGNRSNKEYKKKTTQEKKTKDKDPKRSTNDSKSEENAKLKHVDDNLSKKRKYQFQEEYAAKKKKASPNQNIDNSWSTEFEELIRASCLPTSVSYNDNQMILFESPVPGTSHQVHLQSPEISRDIPSVRSPLYGIVSPIHTSYKRNKFDLKLQREVPSVKTAENAIVLDTLEEKNSQQNLDISVESPKLLHVRQEHHPNEYYKKNPCDSLKHLKSVKEFYKTLPQIPKKIFEIPPGMSMIFGTLNFKDPSKNKLYAVEGPPEEFEGNKSRKKNKKNDTKKCTRKQNYEQFKTGVKGAEHMTYNEFLLRQKTDEKFAKLIE
ncbi:hypothetical protein PUN28_011474 [Cardiocondyla obscurior]|uniref:Uncharacterized protein n=1 Tax=Cardiocondyla obscurior TaxID=286306 RepID=A0AAW2FJQ4_9HYME